MTTDATQEVGRLRHLAKETQQAFGKRLHISLHSINAYESGQRRVSEPAIILRLLREARRLHTGEGTLREALMAALGTTPAELSGLIREPDIRWKSGGL